MGKKKHLHRMLEVQKVTQKVLDQLYTLVHTHGDVEGLKKSAKREELVQDYVFFCIAKGAKSLSAADLLNTEGYFEDVKVLIRSAYECYLNAAYVMNDDQAVDDLVVKKLGLYFGSFKHPVNEKGWPMRNRVEDVETGEISDYKTSVRYMSKNSYCSYDGDVHDDLYGFLSEFVHVHMIASGSYRSKDNKAYMLENLEGAFHTIVLSLYVAVLLLDLAVDYLSDTRRAIGSWAFLDADMQSIAAAQVVEKAVTRMEFGESMPKLKAAMLDRIAVIG